MCLIVFAYRTVPGYSLILAANRDEFYGRPAAPAHFWEESPGLLAGRDLKEGGTWLGIHENGRFSALTNYRKMGAYESDTESRGCLVKNFLQEDIPAGDYLEDLNNGNVVYNGYNLLAGDPEGLYHYSNITRKVTILESGIHGISNALINTPWQKVKETKLRFSKLVEEGSVSDSTLFQLLLNKKTSPSGELPVTGLPAEQEKAVSAVFIQTPEYGTRCSTLLYISEGGDVHFRERTYKAGTTTVGKEKTYDFRIKPLNS